ncbi:MAG: hypothetical protein H6713_31880 [Myxococcales bacterium]|nr:hypothetical protein [Myxococcales bacterium]
MSSTTASDVARQDERELDERELDELERDGDAGAASTSRLRRVIEELAVIRGGELVCADGPQCGGMADWARCGDALGEQSRAGDEVQLITPAGASRAKLVVDARTITLDPQPAGALQLATRTAAPDPGARLERLRLQPPAAPSAALLHWLRARDDRELEPVGQRSIAVGDGVDRVVVVKPPEEPLPEDYDEDDLARRGELVVLLQGGEPRGALPFPPSVGLELVGAVDLDGDGARELLWISRPSTPQLVSELSLSFFDQGEFHVQTLASCSYNGCEGLLPARECGRAFVKRTPRG